MGDSMNEGALEAVLRNTGDVNGFLDEFFSFLARRTDFFVVSPPEGGSIGFPPGVAAQLIIAKFKKWQDYHSSTTSRSPTKEPKVPEPATTVDVQTTPAVEKKEQVSPKTEKVEKGPQLWEDHNGRKADGYTWSQSITEVDAQVVVPRGVKTKRDLEVEIQSRRITIKTKAASEEPVVIEWNLAEAIVKDESYWSLLPGEAVVFTLQKTREKWWDHLFQGEEPLDPSKIEASRPLDELAEDEQAVVRELIHNEDQKRKGLPTSQEQKLEEIMRKAWDAEGSPFKGQPYDPSLVQLASNNIPQ